MSVLSVLLPIGMTTVLSRLHERPDILWKHVMYFVAFLRFCAFLSRKIVVSSAKVSLRDSVLAYVMPFMFFVKLILIQRISIIRIKM